MNRSKEQSAVFQVLRSSGTNCFFLLGLLISLNLSFCFFSAPSFCIDNNSGYSVVEEAPNSGSGLSLFSFAENEDEIPEILFHGESATVSPLTIQGKPERNPAFSGWLGLSFLPPERV